MRAVGFRIRAASLRLGLGVGALVALLCLAACRPSATTVADELGYRGPLSALVPPEVNQVLSARPKQLWQSSAFQHVWRAVVLEERERALFLRTGVEPQQVTDFLAFEVPPSGYVFIVRGDFVADEVVKRLGQRIAVLDVSSDVPYLRREGLKGDGRYAYVGLDRHTLLSAKDASPELLAKLLSRHAAAANGEASETRLTTLTAESQAPLWLARTEPLPFEPGTPIALLFAQQKSLMLEVNPSDPGLSLVLDLQGDFPPGAEHNFRSLLRSVASAPLGSALGLESAAEATEIRVDARGTALAITLDAGLIARATQLLVATEMKDLLF